MRQQQDQADVDEFRHDHLHQLAERPLQPRPRDGGDLGQHPLAQPGPPCVLDVCGGTDPFGHTSVPQHRHGADGQVPVGAVGGPEPVDVLEDVRTRDPQRGPPRLAQPLAVAGVHVVVPALVGPGVPGCAGEPLPPGDELLHGAVRAHHPHHLGDGRDQGLVALQGPGLGARVQRDDEDAGPVGRGEGTAGVDEVAGLGVVARVGPARTQDLAGPPGGADLLEDTQEPVGVGIGERLPRGPSQGPGTEQPGESRVGIDHPVVRPGEDGHRGQ